MGGDWLGHYERAVFFIGGSDPGRLILGYNPIPARPPLVNVLCALFMSVSNRGFVVYQVTNTVLCACPVLAACLVMRRIAPIKRWLHHQAPICLGALLALSPMFVQNATYTWPRGLTNFYVVAGIGFYLIGWQRRERAAMVTAFVMLAAGALSHYSAGPYVVFLTAHYLLCLWRRRAGRMREILTIALICTALLVTWFGWSLRVYGLSATLTSNTSAKGMREHSAWDHFIQSNRNTLYTLVPFPLQRGLIPDFFRTSALAVLRDATFLQYQTNLLLAFGALGWLAVSARLWPARPRAPDQRLTLCFWCSLIVFVVYLGNYMHGTIDYYGLTHICLQPLVLLGLVFIAGGLPALPAMVRRLMVVGCLIDALLGVLLHFYLQSLALPHIPDAQSAGPRMLDAIAEQTMGLGSTAIANTRLKAINNLVYLGDHLEPVNAVLVGAVVIGCLAWWICLVRIVGGTPKLAPLR